MPLYDFKCPECEHEWEQFSKITQRNFILCPQCHEVRGVVQITTVAKPQVLEYYDENLDVKVTGPKQKMRHMRKEGIEEVGGGPKFKKKIHVPVGKANK